MPRKIRQAEDTPRVASETLAEILADELRQNRSSGQPVIDEQVFPTGKIRVVVIWDRWERLSLADRTPVIVRAYELALGKEYRESVALASGLTVIEAAAAGMLPFQIIPALRKGDVVTREECFEAMKREGASTLAGDKPLLRFPTEEDAEAARSRLIEQLPASEPVWVITQDIGSVEEWAER